MATIKRLDQFDILKGIGIIFVILGHCCCPPSYTLTWIYGFHMALFFVVSGFFLKVEPYGTIFKKDFKRILLPYLYFVVLLVIWDAIYFTYKKHSLIAAANIIICNFNPFNEECRSLYHTIWFLPCLFEVHLIYRMMSRLNKNQRTLICIILYCVGYFLQLNKINIPFFVDTSMSVMIYYHCGHLFRHYKLEQKSHNIYAAIGITIIYSVLILLLMPRVEFFMNKFTWYSLPLALSMIYALYVVCCTISSQSTKLSAMLKYCGQNSIMIFGVQSIIIEMLCMITFKLHIQYAFILFIFAVPLSMLFAKISKNHFPFK